MQGARPSDDPKLVQWIRGVETRAAEHFLTAIVSAARHANDENQRLMYPLLKQLQIKYPKYGE